MSRGLLKTLKAVIIMAQFLIASQSLAKEITVFDIRRPVSLENNQEMPKDFYINAGLESGLKNGMIISVNRRQTLYDPFQGKSPGDLVIPVGQLRVIHTQENISVARLVQIMGRETLPGLEFDAIMVGDRLDMSTAKMSKGSDKAMGDGSDGSAFVAVVEIQEAPKPVEAPAQTAPAPVASAAPAAAVKPATPAPVAAAAQAPTRESSSQLPATSLPTQGPTL